MKKNFILLTLSLFTIGSFAQSLDDLKRKPKTTASERVSRTNSYHRSTGWDVDDDTWGFGYNYSSSFPVSFSANYTTSYFYIGGELGVNFKKDKYILADTSREKKTGDPIFYLSVNPGLYVKYWSLSCGVGLLFDSREEEETVSDYSLSSEFIGKSLYVKPCLTGYIPVGYDSYITLSAGYNICPKFKDLNGFSFGAGFQVEL